jgi:hypothetical protein
MILYKNELFERAKRRREQSESEHADTEAGLHESRESLVRYHLLLAQLKETLARA